MLLPETHFYFWPKVTESFHYIIQCIKARLLEMSNFVKWNVDKVLSVQQLKMFTVLCCQVQVSYDKEMNKVVSCKWLWSVIVGKRRIFRERWIDLCPGVLQGLRKQTMCWGSRPAILFLTIFAVACHGT